MRGEICLSKKLYIPNSANEVIIGREGKKIENVEGLELVGRGIDGIVLKLNEEKVIKILKDNIELQKELNKMTYEKVIKFMDDLDLKRIIQPRDILYNKDGKSITINVNHCKSCRYYYIYYSEYLQYQLIYGYEYFSNIQFKDTAQAPNELYGDVESVLHKHGYTVNAKDKLPHNVRVAILEDIISRNIVSKEIVISYLLNGYLI